MHSDGLGSGFAHRPPWVRSFAFVPRIGALEAPRMGAIDVSAATAQGYSVDYVSELQGYAARGGSLPADILAKGETIYKKCVDYVNKGEAVAADVSTGAAIGALIPVLGEIGIGEAAGAIVGAIYGVIDNFGDDIHDLFNPPDFEEGDYQRMQRAQIASGALPVWGVPPDQYGACVYPDGAKSGGDWPYPGTWNGEIRDQAAYDRAKKRDDALQYGIVLGPNGLPVKPHVPLAVAHRASILRALKTYQDGVDASQRVLSNQKIRASLEAALDATLARRRAQTVAYASNTVARNLVQNAIARRLGGGATTSTPATPATTRTDAVKTAAPAPASSPAKTAAIVGGGVSLAGLVGGATWWLLRGRR